ncbi:MAG: DUF2252 family protein [Bryobacteraceae bacterium]
MRSAVDEIIRYNRGFDSYSLGVKLQRLTSSPFGFMRGTFHIFCRDIEDGPFRKWPVLDAAGPIVGDLHTENFGAFRAITGDVVYDINDFDETAAARYEFDLRRLTASLVLAALDSKLRLGDGVRAAEEAVRAYLETLIRVGRVKKRAGFAELHDAKATHRLLNVAVEKSRIEMLRPMVAESTPGAWVLRSSEHYLPIEDRLRQAIVKALPAYLKTALAPKASNPATYAFEDAAFRIAGCGSLGRRRFALLLGKGQAKRKGKAKPKGEALETLRLVEWKDALDSALDSKVQRQSRGRAEYVVAQTLKFQLNPKRYLGYTAMAGRPMQAREIGANDARFAHKQFADPARFETAARIFGEITARAHLLATLGKKGPRGLHQELMGREDRFVNRLLSFAVAYTDRTYADYDDLIRRRDEVAKAWSKR